MTAPASVVNPITTHLRLTFPQIQRSKSPRCPHAKSPTSNRPFTWTKWFVALGPTTCKATKRRVKGIRKRELVVISWFFYYFRTNKKSYPDLALLNLGGTHCQISWSWALILNLVGPTDFAYTFTDNNVCCACAPSQLEEKWDFELNFWCCPQENEKISIMPSLYVSFLLFHFFFFYFSRVHERKYLNTGINVLLYSKYLGEVWNTHFVPSVHLKQNVSTIHAF